MSALSLRTRLVSLAAIVVLPAAATGAVAVVSALERERAALERTLRETSRALALVIDRELELRESAARLLAAAPSLAANRLREFESHARAVTRDDLGWVVVTEHVPDAPPRQIVNTSRPAGASLPTGRGRAGLDPWNDEGATVSDVFRGPLLDDWVVAVTVPGPPSPDGGRLAIGVAMRPMRHLQPVIAQQGLPDHWTASIVDRGGHVVARQPAPERWIGQRAADVVIQRLADGTEGLFRSTTLDGTAVTTYVSRSPKFGWGFVIAVPDVARAAALREAVAGVLVGVGAMVAVAVALAALAGRWIATHVARLAHAARDFERGRPVEYPATGVRELDEVGAALVRADRRVREVNRSLEGDVAEALADARRAHARLSAGQRLEALGRLTGGVAHDVNNLLGVVANNLFVLARLQASPRADEPLQAIRRAVENGRQLTQKLLAFAGRRALEPQVLALDDWLPGAVSLARSSLPPRVALRLEVADDVPRVRVDAGELEMALLNVVVNANDAMPEGGALSIVARRLEAAESPLGAPSAAISIADRGTGIPRELIERVFEPFFTTKDVGKGTGLGLSQVYGFVTRSGGVVDVDSTVGEGTTVRIVLPATDAPVSAPAPAPAPASDAPASRVLYVEDGDELARATAAALESFGHEVRREASAAGALQALGERDFDVVVSDIVMPGGTSGLELALRLRQERPGLPVLLTTGYSGESGEARAAGFTVLHKPCAPEALDAAIRRSAAAARAGRRH